MLLCLCALAVGLSSCDNLRFDGRCLQREVLRQERFAMRKTHAVIRALENNDIDSLHILAHQKDNVMFFIYKGDEVFYWSHAWLNSSGIPFKRVFDQWKFREWNNAYGLCRRTQTGDYFVLTVIPLKYNYSITGEQLSNRFIAPFRGNDNWTLKNRTGDDEHYYLVAYDVAAGIIKHYRVDKMRDTEIMETDRKGEESFKNFDLAAFAKKTFGMYGGVDAEVMLECRNELAGVVIDRFGHDVWMCPHGEDHFRTRVPVSVSSQFFGWLTGVGSGMRIVGPEDVKQQYKVYLQSVLRNY